MEFIKHLYSYVDSPLEFSALMTGIATVVLAIITWRYVRLTKHILEEHRLMRLDANKPEIMVSLLPHETHIAWVMFYVENIGTGLARHLKFTADPSSISSFDRPLEEIGFLKREIEVLAPGRKMQSFLVSAVGKFDELKQQPLKITVTYKDSEDGEYAETFPLDFSELEGLSHEGSPLFEIAKAIQDVKKVLRDLTTGVSKPTILTEPLSKHLIREHASILEKKLAHLPDEAQQEIVQEIVSLITRKEREVPTEEQNKKTITEYVGDEIRGQINIEKEFAIADKMTRSAETDSTDAPDPSE